MIIIVHITDTHMLHDDLSIPYGDILIHTGDATSSGSEWETQRFFDWFSRQQHLIKIFVPGNHDIHFDKAVNKGEKPGWVNKMIATFRKQKGCYYLEHEALDVWGVKFFGSPYGPSPFGDKPTPYGFQYDPKDASAHWVDIPNDTDILLTHVPPWGKLDLTFTPLSRTGDRIGCPALRYFVKQVKPKIHLFGHVHEDYGAVQDEHTLYCNSSSIDYLKTHRTNEPTVLEYRRKTGQVRFVKNQLITNDLPF